MPLLCPPGPGGHRPHGLNLMMETVSAYWVLTMSPAMCFILSNLLIHSSAFIVYYVLGTALGTAVSKWIQTPSPEELTLVWGEEGRQQKHK